MNGKDILVGLGYIHSSFFEEAETEGLSSPSAARSNPLRRPLLVAAIVALTLLLVGCAVVYALRLQDMSIGQETYIQQFDESGKYLETPVEKTKDIMTMSGHSGDAIQTALAEWFAFLETYDPDLALMSNEPNIAAIPDRYEYTYGCYTQDMVEKVDAIARKYGLKLLDLPLTIQRWQSDIFLRETGISSFALPSSGFQISNMSGIFYLPNNFVMDFELAIEDIGRKINATYSYTRKDYFPSEYPNGMDLTEYSQWDMTASDGTMLLLALNSKGRGFIIAERDDAMIHISVNGNFSGSAYPEEKEIITRAELESLAAGFDYAIRPQTVDQVAFEALLAEAEAAYQAEHTYIPEVYGSFNAYLQSNYRIPNPALQYTFYDVNGDGAQELLIGSDGAITEWLALRDGQVIPYGIAACYLCEGYVREYYETADELSDFERHGYFAPESEGAYFADDPEADGELIVGITCMQGKWYQSKDYYWYEDAEISEADARRIIAKYPRIQLDWKPLMEYPLDDRGMTLGEHLEAKDVRVSDDELIQIYKDHLNAKEDLWYTHYRILDINGDDVDDLLVSGDGEKYWNILTYRYGMVTSVLTADFYLCEDGVIERTTTEHRDQGVEVERHRYMRLQDMTVRTTLAFAAYNRATDSWESDYDATPMDKEIAQAVIARYPRIDQGMGPISELLK